MLSSYVLPLTVAKIFIFTFSVLLQLVCRKNNFLKQNEFNPFAFLTERETLLNCPYPYIHVRIRTISYQYQNICHCAIL